MTRSQQLALALSPGNFRRWLEMQSMTATAEERLEEYLREKLQGVFIVSFLNAWVFEQLTASRILEKPEDCAMVATPRWMHLFMYAYSNRVSRSLRDADIAFTPKYQLRILRLIHKYEYDNKRNKR